MRILTKFQIVKAVWVFFLGIVVLSACSFIGKSTPLLPPDFNEWIDRFFSEAICELPCWEGITPGQTTIAEAVQILQTNPDYKNISGPIKVSYGFPEYYEMNWVTANGNGGGLAWSKEEDNYVSEILLSFQNESPSISLECIVSNFGEPDSIIVKEDRENICSGQIYYVQKGMEVLVIGKCQKGHLSISSMTQVYNILLFPINKLGFPDNNYWVTGNKEFLVDWIGFRKYPITDKLR